MDQTIAIRLFFCLNNFDFTQNAPDESPTSLFGAWSAGDRYPPALSRNRRYRGLPSCAVVRRISAGAGHYFAGRSADRFAPDFCRIFSQAPEPKGPPEAALCQGDSMPPPVCRGSGRTVMFHTADSRGGIQTDQSWGRYWRFSERAGGAAAGNCRHRWHARPLHHRAFRVPSSFPLPAASNLRRGRAGANE